MEITIIMQKSNLKKKHHDHALEWHDDKKAYWISDDTDNWKTEECAFDFQDGKFTVSLINDDGLFVSLVVPLFELSMAASKVCLSSVIDRNIEQLKDAKNAFEKLRLE